MQEEEVKGVQTGNIEAKLSLFADDMILYMRELEDSIKTLSEPINEFGKAAGYKINEHKFMALIHTNNSMAEKERVRTVPLKIAKKILKYPGINLIRNVQDLYDEHCKT